MFAQMLGFLVHIKSNVTTISCVNIQWPIGWVFKNILEKLNLVTCTSIHSHNELHHALAEIDVEM